ncbi:hypothetical protein [Micromonospora sp. NPDC049799]|uniref:hypothetical protein n=1 Tax=Micromonospora sp. NPDC049799 TaxID=3154741 RepID=UPI0033C3F40C
MYRTPLQSPKGRRKTALVLGALFSVATVLPAAPAAAAPPRADLVVIATAPRNEVVDVGGGATVVVDVRNGGNRPLADVTLTFTMPSGADFTDGNSTPAGWQCDFRVSRTCTYGALAAGASAPQLRFDFYFPPAAPGTTAAVTVTGTTTSTESTTANNTATGPITYIRGVADVEVTGVGAPAQVITGDTVDIRVDVRNTGNMTAEEVYVTVPIPTGFARQTEDMSTGWDCVVVEDPATGSAWRCTRYQIVAGYSADTLHLTATVTSAQPGAAWAVVARASTNVPEDDLTDNEGRTDVAVVEAATVSGIVWQDADRDGVRDVEESGVTGAGTWVSVNPADQTLPAVAGTRGADGTWTARVRPGTYSVVISIDKPYLFIDSVDSDLASYDNAYPYSSLGYSDTLVLAAGDAAVVDAGVVTS